MQTTRTAIKAIITNDNYQIIITDTPGIHKPKNKLGETMIDTAYKIMEDVDCILFLIEADHNKIGPGEQIILKKIIDSKKKCILVINKIDLPSARPDEIKQEIEEVIGLPADSAPLISAKEGRNITDVLVDIVKNVPAPQGDENAPLKALIFDCSYDNYKGVIILTRIVDGEVKVGTKIKMFQTANTFDVTEVGVFAPSLRPVDKLSAGDVGYICASIKTVQDTKVGDTITDADNPCTEPLPGYKKILPMVYCGIYPADGSKYNDLKEGDRVECYEVQEIKAEL